MRDATLAICTLTFVGAVTIASCGDGVTAPGDLSPAQIERVGARLGIAALAAATGGQGRSFFDNFIACPRRGVIDYSNTSDGRRVALSGCDLGDGVVIEGNGEVRWTHTGPVTTRAEFCIVATPAPFCAAGLEWQGSLTVTIDDLSVTIVSFTVSDLAMRADGVPFPDDLRIETADLGFSSMRVAALQTTTEVTDASLVTAAFDPVLTSAAIPNPSNDLDALTEADLKRIAFQAALELGSFLFNETLETQRGDHTHDTECGTSDVVVVGQLPEVTNTWSDCEAAGTFYSGTFALSWDELDVDSPRLPMIVDGTITLSGSVPTITLDRLSWTVDVSDGLGNEVRFSGALETATESRPFDFRVVVDD